jgi:probable rRNA maturation factor
MATHKRVTVYIDRTFHERTSKAWLRQVARAVLSHEVPDSEVELSLVITGDQEVQQLNREYRGIDDTTDVLSFPFTAGQHEKETNEFVSPPDGILHLGEVLLSYPQAVKQAREEKHSVEYEMAVLVVHGILHLLGYDHVGREARHMKAREKTILGSLSGGRRRASLTNRKK